MGDFRNVVRCAAIALGMAGALALSACSIPGKIGQMSKFDISKASPDDIAEALKKDGRVAISAGILFDTDSAKLSPSADDVVGRIAKVMKEHPDLKHNMLSAMGNLHPDRLLDTRYLHSADEAPEPELFPIVTEL